MGIILAAPLNKSKTGGSHSSKRVQHCNSNLTPKSQLNKPSCTSAWLVVKSKSGLIKSKRGNQIITICDNYFTLQQDTAFFPWKLRFIYLTTACRNQEVLNSNCNHLFLKFVLYCTTINWIHIGPVNDDRWFNYIS